MGTKKPWKYLTAFSHFVFSLCYFIYFYGIGTHYLQTFHFMYICAAIFWSKINKKQLIYKMYEDESILKPLEICFYINLKHLPASSFFFYLLFYILNKLIHIFHSFLVFLFHKRHQTNTRTVNELKRNFWVISIKGKNEQIGRYAKVIIFLQVIVWDLICICYEKYTLTLVFNINMF